MKLFEKIYRESFASDKKNWEKANAEFDRLEGRAGGAYKDELYISDENRNVYYKISKKIADIFADHGFEINLNASHNVDRDGNLAYDWGNGRAQGFDATKLGMTFFVQYLNRNDWKIQEVKNKLSNSFGNADIENRGGQNYFIGIEANTFRDKANRMKNLVEIYSEISEIEDQLEKFRIELDTERLPEIDTTPYNDEANEAKKKKQMATYKVGSSWRNEAVKEGDKVTFHDSRGNKRDATVLSVDKDSYNAKIRTDAGAVRIMTLDALEPADFQ